MGCLLRALSEHLLSLRCGFFGNRIRRTQWIERLKSDRETKFIWSVVSLFSHVLCFLFLLLLSKTYSCQASRGYHHFIRSSCLNASRSGRLVSLGLSKERRYGKIPQRGDSGAGRREEQQDKSSGLNIAHSCWIP